MSEIKLGRYSHYKGGVYTVIFVGRHTESDEDVVVYQSDVDRQVWVRPLEMFMELVEVDGNQRPRFRFEQEASLKELADRVLRAS